MSELGQRSGGVMRRLNSIIASTAIRALVFLVIAIGFLGVSAADAGTLATEFDAANKLYEEGKFTDASSAYERLALSSEASAAVYFNLGNALFKSGQIGRAIAAYRQAQRMTPRDPDVRANLQFARNQTKGPTLAPTPWQRWLTRLTLNEWTAVASAAVWFLLLALAAIQWRPELKRTFRTWIWVLTAVALILCACLGVAWEEDVIKRTAIIVTRDVVVRLGPLDESQSAFTVSDGAELKVLDRNEDWLQVTVDGRRVGWLRKNQVVLDPRS